jgi:zinc protease
MVRTEPPRRAVIRPGRLRRASAACLLLCLGAMAAAGAGAVTEVKPPRLTYGVSTLPNGLTLILHEDHSTPIVNVQVWYHVGSKNERPGRRGLAHLFEHLMFNGSRNVQPEQHSSLIAAAGGLSNAYTTEDVTVFWETVPSQSLPLTLWLEADRMATLRIERQEFEREREIVKEERRMRVENQPYGRLSEIVSGYAFTVHPYRYPTIGSMADFDVTVTLDDVRAFYRTFYVPSNATVVIAGDIDAASAADLVAKYFGRIPRPGHTVPRDLPAEPPLKAPKRLAIEESWPLPVVVIAHHVVADGHPDSYPLYVAAKILSDGQSSRLYRKLVYETGIAMSAAGVGDLREHPKLFYAYAIVQPGHTANEAETALATELDRLRSEPVSEPELARARIQFTRDFVMGRQTVQQKASMLGHASVLHGGDMASADAELDRFHRVTAADIQRVAQAYFTPSSRMAITVSPKLAKGERP